MTKWLLAVAAFLLFVVFPLSAPAAERILENGRGDYILLLDEPCVSVAGALTNLSDEARKIARRASIWYQQKLYDACYAEAEGFVFLVDELGGQGVMSSEQFRPKHGT